MHSRGLQEQRCFTESKRVPQVPVYRFPSAKNESEMRKKWIDAVVNHNKELVVTEYSVVCAKHWLLALKSTARMVVKDQQNLLFYLVTFQSQTSYLLR